MQQVYRRIQEKNNQNATIEQGILGAYGSLGIFMKLADRRAGDVDIDIGIHVNPQTGEIT
ncbi:hypothetical protein KC711_00640 [Candidatus Peregrinibacteria bacterium]|nr:hypothetical protein [Candidatus Peregrinibacteria bacterium]MCB9805157.1 hypothetical protein [Candidatus Peribacteria bacterium]